MEAKKRPLPQALGKTSPFTRVSQILIGIAIIVMGYIYLSHRNSPTDAEWVTYALMMMIFALAGYVGTQMIYQQPVFPTVMRPLDLNTGVHAAIILVACLVTQIVTQTVLAFTVAEQVLYFVFAAVCEEVFFRVLIISAMLKFKDDLNMRIFAVVLQAALFVAIHQNYYANLPMLISVFIGGIVLGIFYVVWRDPTANILAHFILNVYAVQNLLIMLGALGSAQMAAIMTGVTMLILCIVMIFRVKRR